jgi:predicted kinase
LLERRASAGFVRHCHGDLHLRNIVELDGAPVLFDAIEFDDRLATIDVLYDLAFLLMDLGKRRLHAHANLLLNAYLEHEVGTGDLVGLATLPLFLSMRAAIRAKVELLRAPLMRSTEAKAARSEARAYFDLARKFLAPAEPRLIAIGGLSGSGKSAVSRAIAPFIGAFPGAVHVRSDVERKRLFGVAPTERLSTSAYAPEISDYVYAICRKRALMALQGGQAVIVDAVHAKPEEREAIAALAAKMRVPFTGLWLEASPEVMRERVASRSGDVSDATPNIVNIQLSYELGPRGFAEIDASLPVEQVAAACLERIGVSTDEAPKFMVC